MCCGFTDADDSDSEQTPPPLSTSAATGVVTSRSAPKRQRYKFKEQWKEAYPNESEGYMTCILCSEKLTSFKVLTH